MGLSGHISGTKKVGNQQQVCSDEVPTPQRTNPSSEPPHALCCSACLCPLYQQKGV